MLIDCHYSDAMTPEKGVFSSDVTAAIMEKESIKRKIANILLQGLPGTGKTSLLDRLLNKPFRAYYSSTGISEKVVLVEIGPSSTHTTVYACEDNTWKVTDFDESMVSQLDSCKGFIPNSAGEESSLHPGMTQKHPRLDTNELASDIECHVREVLSKHNVKNIADLQRKSSIYIRDTGGQVEFQESLSLLIFGPSIFIFVLKTNVDIHSKNTIQYRSATKEIINQYRSKISTMDALIQFLTSVSAIHITEEGVFQIDGTSVCHKPIVFIVGTHIDKLGSEAQSKLASINDVLYEMICERKFKHLVHLPNSACMKAMYEVDNTCEVDPGLRSLRSDINQYMKKGDEFLVEFRVSFLLFCLELNNIKETIISMDQCKTLAAKFNIEDNEIDTLLHFLHFRVGIIQHYNVKGISDVIIKEPYVLFNKVTELILNTFLSSGSISMSQQERFCKKGILELCAFENLLSKEDQITPQQFILFLRHLRVAVPFTDKSGLQKYFIPLILNHVPKSPLERVDTVIAPLAITFQLGHCPKGLFGVLISYLLCPEGNQELTFDLLEDRIYQDQVSLLVSSSEDVDQICLRSCISHLEVSVVLENYPPASNSATYAPRATSPNKVCNNIRVMLDNCIQLSLKKLHYSCDKVGTAFSLTCPLKCGSPHEVRSGVHSLYMRCSRRGKLTVPESGCLWFNKGK